MADRRARTLAACRAVAHARRAGAESEHARSLSGEAAAMRDAAAAADALAGAADAWRSEREAGFDPALGTLLARQVLACEAGAAAADRRHAAAADAREQAAHRWREQDGLCRGVDDRVGAMRRRAAARADDRRLAGMADRLTFTWTRR